MYLGTKILHKRIENIQETHLLAWKEEENNKINEVH